ncbi:MAG: class I SAM-dependent methyltransferase [Planctomycetes bacterium]|nr:class I SAM-dependent methyltransferase [Planctomycetota bacterium]
MNRKKHWETIYANKSPLEVSWYQKEPLLSLQLIHNTGIGKDAFIIDIGGGTSVLVDCLRDKGFSQITALDISANALAFTKNRLGGKAQKIQWIEADITEFIAPHLFDLWHDRAVFHFLTDPSDRKKYVGVLQNSLKRGGHLIVAAFAIGGSKKCSGLDIEQYDAQKLQNELGSEFLLMEETGEIHITPSGKEQKFGFFRFMRK